MQAISALFDRYIDIQLTNTRSYLQRWSKLVLSSACCFQPLVKHGMESYVWRCPAIWTLGTLLYIVIYIPRVRQVSVETYRVK